MRARAKTKSMARSNGSATRLRVSAPCPRRHDVDEDGFPQFLAKPRHCGDGADAGIAIASLDPRGDEIVCEIKHAHVGRFGREAKHDYLAA